MGGCLRSAVKGRLTSNEAGRNLEGDRDIVCLNRGMLPGCTCLSKHRTVHLIRVQLIACKSYFNKVQEENKESKVKIFGIFLQPKEAWLHLHLALLAARVCIIHVLC